MRSTFHGIEVSKRALFAQQSALDTTSHNIANASTEGYTRQRANMQATTAIPAPGINNSTAPGQLGTGVQVTGLQRIRESFLDTQIRTENKHLGYWDAVESGLGKLEVIMNEPSDTGLQTVMDSLWQSWQDLAKEPNSLSARAVVSQRATAVTETFSSVMTSMSELQTDLDNTIASNVLDINSVAKQIADLNKQIADVVPHGYQPNDLYDQRDVLLDKLSKMADIKTTEAESGMVNVTIEGKELITGRTSIEMATVRNPQTGYYDITLDGAEFKPTSQGTLSGNLKVRGEATVQTINGQTVVTKTGYIPDLVSRLNTLAVTLTSELNKLHQTGANIFDIENRKTNPNAPLQGLMFFVDSTDPTKPPTDASKMALNPAIVANLNSIAAAQTIASEGSQAGTSFEGDGRNARDIASIKFHVFSSTEGLGESTTLDDYYRYSIAKLGVDSQEAQRMDKNSEILVQQVENQRQSISGVSLDEEMSEMIKYQHAYNAAARVMTSMDELLDKVINGMGRVGL